MYKPLKYRLAVVPKVPKRAEYSSAYGSQHDYSYLKSCIRTIVERRNLLLDIDVLQEKAFFRKQKKYAGVLFIGISDAAKEFLQQTSDVDKYVWAFNQVDWINKPEIFDHTRIVFEQSTRELAHKVGPFTDFYYLPLGFQEDRKTIDHQYQEYDIVFNGTLDRSRRVTAQFHRKDLLSYILQAGVTVINFNGRSNTEVEHNLLEDLKHYSNFQVVNCFGDVEHYRAGNYALNVPFHEIGSKDDIAADWGMSHYERENGNWLIHWDIFRCIGAKSNMVTFDCRETRELGLNDQSCHFYSTDPTDVEQMAREIVQIVKSGEKKSIPVSVWEQNSYRSRWIFMLDKVAKKITEH